MWLCLIKAQICIYFKLFILNYKFPKFINIYVFSLNYYQPFQISNISYIPSLTRILDYEKVCLFLSDCLLSLLIKAIITHGPPCHFLLESFLFFAEVLSPGVVYKAIFLGKFSEVHLSKLQKIKIFHFHRNIIYLNKSTFKVLFLHTFLSFNLSANNFLPYHLCNNSVSSALVCNASLAYT